MIGILAINIKSLRKKEGYTQNELAAMLGVGQTTIANYENGSRIPDADKINKLASIFNISIDSLFGREENSKIESVMENKAIEQYNHKKYLHYLIEGDRDIARDMILKCYESGVPIAYIYFEIFKKALEKVGQMWEMGKLEIWKEHYICEFTIDMMREIKAREKINRKGPKCILGLTAGTEMHNIGLKMVLDMLELEGARTIYLGSIVPTESLLNAIKEEKPDIVAISVTMEGYLEAVTNMISAIKDRFGKKRPKIVVGGKAFFNLYVDWKNTGADCFSNDAKEMINIMGLAGY